MPPISSEAVTIALMALSVPAISAAGAGVAFVFGRVIEHRKSRFETFHRLLANLVRGVGDKPFADEQIAALFELRRYRHYYPILPGILRNLTATWEALDSSAAAYLVPALRRATEDIEAWNHRQRWWAPWRSWSSA